MQTHPNLSMDYLPVIVREDSLISSLTVILCCALTIGSITYMGIFFKWHVSDFMFITILTSLFLAFFLGLFYRKIDLYLNTRMVKWESARWPLLKIKWEQPFSSYKYLVIEETTPSLDGPELLYFKPDRLTLIRRGKYDNIESRILHIMLYHSTEPEKYSISLACFEFSEASQAQQYLYSAHTLLGLPTAVLKNGNLEETR